MSNLSIVSGGTAGTTKLYVDGVELTDVYSIEIDKITPDGLLGATIKLHGVKLGEVADDRQSSDRT